MNSFLDFILKDIETKRNLITSMPTRTKTNKNKLNNTILEIEEKYNEYKLNVKTYLTVKSKSFELKKVDKDVIKVKENIESLEQVKFLLNKTNTYVEKLGFDELLYKINNFSMFNFSSLNEIINGFLDKFDSINVKLKDKDFDYSIFVNEYMHEFLEVRYGNEKKYDKVSETFERIYWINPDLIDHIALNFRKLIRKYSKEFNNYVLKLQKNVKFENHIDNYDECISKLKNEYIKLQELEEEDAQDIISLALNGGFDINQYLPDSKVRINAFQSLIHEDVDLDDTKTMDKICEILLKFKYNVVEYMKYLDFVPLFEYFRNNYKNLISVSIESKDKNKVKDENNLREIVNQISLKEKELEKHNHKIFGPKTSIFDVRSKTVVQAAKIKSNHLVRELSDLYKKYDEEYFKDKIKSVISNDMTIDEVLHLYYSFNYFKKRDIQKAYETTDYNEILGYSNNFDVFATNSNNLIVSGILTFEDTDVAKVICNKYKLNNIKIDDADLSEENLKLLYNKIVLILRVNTINNSKSSLEKIWFMVQVKKIKSVENEQ